MERNFKSTTRMEGLEIRLKFKYGIYNTNKNGRETNLIKPVSLVIKIDPSYNSFEKTLKIKHLNYKKKIYPLWIICF